MKNKKINAALREIKPGNQEQTTDKKVLKNMNSMVEQNIILFSNWEFRAATPWKHVCLLVTFGKWFMPVSKESFSKTFFFIMSA